MKTKRDFDREFLQATREAELGQATCRVCHRKGAFSEFITVLFGGGLVYAICLPCVDRGEAILIKRGERGIEVLKQTTGLITAATDRDLGILKKRVS